MDLALKENIFQVETETRIREITNGVYRRLSSFSEDILEYFLRTDTNSAKVFVLISILKEDRLFFEFMYEVFREHIILGDFTLKPKDFERFFDEKSYQSDAVSEWTEETVERLKRGYTVTVKKGVLNLKFKYNKVKFSKKGTYAFKVTYKGNSQYKGKTSKGTLKIK